MARLPHSAKTLIGQVRDRYRRRSDSQAGLNTGVPHGEVDGFGVYRTVKFDKTSSKWLASVLAEVDDPRIVSVTTENGQTLVTFSHRTLADDRSPFPLDAAEIVAAENDGATSDGSDA